MAERSSFGVSARANWQRRLAGVALVLLGSAGVGTAGWVYVDAWLTSQAWQASPQAAELARQAVEPTPVWLPDATPAPVRVPIEPLPIPRTATPLAPSVPLLVVEPSPTPTVIATTDELSLDATDFRFLDPPEPDAHARVTITVSNHAVGTSSGRILLGVPASWFEDYRIIGTAPVVSDDRTDDLGLRTFSFPPLPAGSAATYELHVSSIGEGTQAPTVKVLQGGDVIGEDKPSTAAPEPRPGPVMSIDIPALKLHSSVVQNVWEPPPYVVGQVNGSANITEGNTVLVGHLTGAAGNVFAHLDQLKPGDEITAMSRGLPYSFVVSRTIESTNTDTAPLKPADDARLTLMTCAGIWNPFTHDYSARLWIIAEPPDQAAQTIADAAATATAVAASTATALALEPTQTPMPTPYTGQPSLPGGLGNSRVDLEKVLGAATGETAGKLVVFRRPGREFHVQFTPDPPRAALVAEILAPESRMPFEAAVREARKLFPSDTGPRAAAPEGNSQFVVERFTSPALALALGEGNFTVVYTRDPSGAITSILLGLGDDFEALMQQSRR